MDYASIRLVHITCAFISVGLFTLRGLCQWRAVDWRRWRWLRVAPHVNDTVLLCAAVTLAAMSSQYPLVQPWLTAKLLYIGLGGVALSPKVGSGVNRLAFLFALVCVGYILWVARSRSPWLGLLP